MPGVNMGFDESALTNGSNAQEGCVDVAESVCGLLLLGEGAVLQEKIAHNSAPHSNRWIFFFI